MASSNSSDCSTPRKHHVLAVPLPAQGHINPMMRFCRKLAREGVMVTFVHVDLVHDRLQQLIKSSTSSSEEEKEADDDNLDDQKQLCSTDNGGMMRTTHVPVEGLDLSRGFAVSSEDFFEAQKSIAPHLQRLLLRLRRAGTPVTCLLSDVSMTAPTQPLADSFHLPRIALYPSSPSILLFYSFLLAAHLHHDTPVHPHSSAAASTALSSKDVLEALAKGSKAKMEVFARGLEGLPSLITNADLPHFQHVTNDNLYMFNFLDRETIQSFKKAHCIVVNSYHELEGPAFETLSTRVNLPIYGIGPLVEHLKDDNTTSLWKEDEACMLWLDQQAPLSVLYISFGSVTLLSHAQFQEILDGLLSTGQSFLWVFRPGLVLDSSSPIELEELMSKAQGRGYFVGWAPQVQVLSHPAIGGFLTHCGWNSTIEAISLGVPMLCWPYLADQFFNAKYVTEVWNIGLRFTMDEESALVNKDEIERVTIALMQGDQGKVLRENATKLKEACCNTVLPEGASHNSLHALLSSL